MTKGSQSLGLLAEEAARDYLLQQGLTWLASNYRCRAGEIDLIMRHRDYIVFVEVRARRSSAYGGAIASVTFNKRQKLIRAASVYLLQKDLYNHPCRFDIVSLEGAELKMTWIQNAFDATE